MSKTLFWYLLKDLLRIFMLASGTLAGIMSFGALLRPLTQHGLDASQVGKILSYFSPAMTTYSLPIAALFATTIVYGRLSADNELTACRASGISHLAMTWPAILLGLIVALVSLLFLSFIVPVFTLKVEKVIYSNIAQLIANKITRTHEISYGKTSIFAQAARVVEPTDQVLFIAADEGMIARLVARLDAAGLKPRQEGSYIVIAYGDADTRAKLAPRSDVPGAIDPGGDDILKELSDHDRANIRMAYLSSGMDQPTRQQAIEQAKPIPQALRELPPINVQIVELISPMIFSYMTVDAPDIDPELASDKNSKANRMKVPSKIWIARRATAYVTQKDDKVILEAVLEDGSNFPRGTGGSQVSVAQAQFGPVEVGSPIRENTKFMDVRELKQLLSRPESSRKLRNTVQQFVRDEQRALYFDQVARSLVNPQLRSFRFTAETETLIVSGTDLDVRTRGTELIINPRTDQENQRVRVDRESNGEIVSSDRARQVRITMEPLEAAHQGVSSATASRRMLVSVRGYDVIVEADEDPAAHETFPRSINLPMPAELLKVETHDVKYYLGLRTRGKEQEELKNSYNKLLGSIRSEMHSRASFAVSCFILVMVGCALGMISRSGNFLSAFAVSVAPALLCIALIVTGQHVCENTPKQMGMGLSLIWSGNVIVSILGMILLGKLQRQ